MKKYLCLIVFLLTFLTVSAQTDTLQQRISGRRNSTAQIKKPYVIIISADGFRYDYAQKYQTKNILELAASGVQAEYMIPSFPTVTRPNHFSIMSGLYPAHSGIVGNSFYDANRKQHSDDSDPTFITAEPFWITAEKRNLITASMYWPNSIFPIQGVFPTYYFERPGKDHPNLSMDDRANTLKDWLAMPEDTRPHFISIYFGGADHEGHTHGPDSPELIREIQSIDEAVGKLAAVAKSSGLPVNFIFVSDHGMFSADKRAIPMPGVDTSKFVVNRVGALVNYHAKNLADIVPTYQKMKAEKHSNVDVYLKKDVPSEWHLGEKDDRFNRIGDILVMARFPFTFGPKVPAGSHGFLPTQPEMRAVFYAWGPAFKEKLTIPGFQNVEVYELMASILGIKPLPNDGTGKLAKEILK